MRSRTLTLLLVLLIALLVGADARANTLYLEWDPADPATESADPDLATAGYVVLWGTEPGVYTSDQDVGLVTTYRVDGLADGTTYCFVVRAYDAAGDFSVPSNEICHTTSGVALPPSPPPPPPPDSTSSAPSAPSGGGGSAPAASGGGGGAASGGSASGSASVGKSAGPAAIGSFALNVTVRDNRFIDLSWGEGPAGTDGYRVEFGRAPGHTAVTARTRNTATTFDLGAVGGGTYFVRVRALGGTRFVAVSDEAIVRIQELSPAPQAFAATMVGRSAQLSWQPPLDGLGASSYQVEIGSASGAADVATITVPGLSAVVDNLADGFYYLRVRAMRPSGLGEPSREATLTIAGGVAQCTAPPAPPTSLVAVAHGALVQLSWQPGSGEAPTSYVLYVGSAVGQQDLMTIPLGAVTGLSATAGDGYYALRLVAFNACGASEWGAEAELVVGQGAPAAGNAEGVELPGAPDMVIGDVVDSLVTIQWGAPVTGGAVTHYVIEAMTAGGPVALNTGNPATAFSHPNTPPGEYVVRVRAGNAAGVGPASEPITVVVP